MTVAIRLALFFEPIYMYDMFYIPWLKASRICGNKYNYDDLMI
jgi:hypothetical protein